MLFGICSSFSGACSRLSGLKRAARDVTPSLQEYLAMETRADRRSLVGGKTIGVEAHPNNNPAASDKTRGPTNR
jgi:glutathione synthase/RimK-type ligase-like ATP-grasp enzyme